MTHSNFNPHQPNYFCILTHEVMFCDAIEQGAKLLFAFITSLTYAEGYCFASNAYFAEKFKVEERTITNWLQSLKEQKFIYVETVKNGMYWDRKIFVILEKFTKGKNFPDREEKNFPIEGTKFSSDKEKSLYKESSKQQTRVREELPALPACQPAAAFFACIEELTFSDKEKIALCALANEEIVSNAVAKYKQRLAEGYEPDNCYGFLKSLIIAKEKPVKTKADSSRDNQFLALEMKNKVILPSYAYFEVLSSGVEIGYITGQKEPYLIEYDAKGFSSQVESAVRKVGGNFKL